MSIRISRMEVPLRPIGVIAVLILALTTVGIVVAGTNNYFPFISTVINPSPTPQPTAKTTQVYVVGVISLNSFVDSTNHLHIMGEIENRTPDDIGSIQISFSLFDSNDKFLTSISSNTILSILPANYKTCFDLVMNNPGQWSSIVVGQAHYSVMNKTLPKLTVTESNGSITPLNTYIISGFVRNDGPTTLKYVKIVGTLYATPGDVGEVIGCKYTYTVNDTLAPAETSGFTLMYSEQSTYSNVSNYRLQEEGVQP